jgi:hypothetical protein
VGPRGIDAALVGWVRQWVGAVRFSIERLRLFSLCRTGAWPVGVEGFSAGVLRDEGFMVRPGFNLSIKVLHVGTCTYASYPILVYTVRNFDFYHILHKLLSGSNS